MSNQTHARFIHVRSAASPTVGGRTAVRSPSLSSTAKAPPTLCSYTILLLVIGAVGTLFILNAMTFFNGGSSGGTEDEDFLSSAHTHPSGHAAGHQQQHRDFDHTPSHGSHLLAAVRKIVSDAGPSWHHTKTTTPDLPSFSHLPSVEMPNAPKVQIKPATYRVPLPGADSLSQIANGNTMSRPSPSPPPSVTHRPSPLPSPLPAPLAATLPPSPSASPSPSPAPSPSPSPSTTKGSLLLRTRTISLDGDTPAPSPSPSYSPPPSPSPAPDNGAHSVPTATTERLKVAGHLAGVSVPIVTSRGQPGNTFHAMYHADLSSSPPANDCFNKFGWGMSERWDWTKKTFCAPSNPASVGALDGDSQLECRVTQLPHLPAPTAPHTLCDGKGLMMDFSKFELAPCMKHRPGYFCDEKTYYNYNRGAILGKCTKTADFSIERFPRDHLRDEFDSFAEFHGDSSSFAIENGVTVFVTRERGEHNNIYHTMTDFFNAFISLEMLKVDVSQVQIVLLDDHAPGRFDSVWDTVYSKKTKLRRARDFMGPNPQKVWFEHAIFSPPGYTNIFLAELMEKQTQCRQESGLLSAFARHMLTSFGISTNIGKIKVPPPSEIKTDVALPTIKVLLVSRKPFDGRTVSRVMKNEGEVADMMRSHELVGGMGVRVVDFTGMSFDDQLRLVADHDLLVGMHGAGLTHLLWLPPHGGLIELRQSTAINWYSYEHMAYWRGLDFRAWESEIVQPAEAPVSIHIETFKPIYREMVQSVAARKLFAHNFAGNKR